MKRTHVFLPDDLLADLRAVSEETETSMAALIREAVRDRIARHERGKYRSALRYRQEFKMGTAWHIQNYVRPVIDMRGVFEYRMCVKVDRFLLERRLRLTLAMLSDPSGRVGAALMLRKIRNNLRTDVRLCREFGRPIDSTAPIGAEAGRPDFRTDRLYVRTAAPA